MDIDTYISYCKQRLKDIDKIFLQMEKDGIPKSVSVWDVLDEKYRWWTSRLEACAQTDPGNSYQFTGDEYYWN